MYYGSFDVGMALLTTVINDLKWRCESIPALYNEIRKGTSKITLKVKVLPVKVSSIYKLTHEYFSVQNLA